LEDAECNIDSLAAKVNMSRSSLHRKIKGMMSMTPNDFVKVIRLKRAAELIGEGHYRINEIASLVGYNSISYFSRSFFKQFGVLPKDFGKKSD
ncbi:MAG: AraC family transcriptional regulator, partial [Muribaculaceae bacterium]|nr:AraC family transcriptional regulator [Muribaculaceae bacterium]